MKFNERLLPSIVYKDIVIDSIPAGIMTSDLKGNILSINEYIIDLFGYSEEETLKMMACEFFDGWAKAVNEIKLKETFLDEDVYVHTKKNVLQYNLSIYPIRGNKGVLEGLVYVFKELKKVRKTANKIMGRQAIYTFDKILGKNKGFLEVIEFAKQVSSSRSTILIMGESGTGKEIFAQSIHNYSDRRNEPFIALNCGAIPKNLIESELFGYEEGAFTGAKKSGHPGKFEVADGGTFFLDEVAEMPIDMQTRLLRVVEEGTVSRIGSTKETVVDVRIIAATNKDLFDEINRGNFRKDLFYRLNVLPIRLPALRERKDDIPLLIDYFMNRISKRINKKPVYISKDYLNELIDYHWPGNIRELENLIELMLNTGELYYKNSKNKNTENIKHMEDGELVDMRLETLEKEHILKVLKTFDGNITKSAKALGIGRNTLYRKLERYG